LARRQLLYSVKLRIAEALDIFKLNVSSQYVIVKPAMRIAHRFASSVRCSHSVLIVLLSGMAGIMACNGHADAQDSSLHWSRGGQATAAAEQFLEVLTHAENYGLNAENYAAASLQAEALHARQSHNPGDWLSFDSHLDTALLEFMHDVHFGRIDPRLAGFDLAAPRPELRTTQILSAWTQTTHAVSDIARIEPPFGHYQLLKQALAHYRQLEQQSNTWPALPKAIDHSLRAGDACSWAPALRLWLQKLGDLPPAADPADAIPANENDLTFDETLSSAVRNFQTRHGLTADGILGMSTLTALRVPLSKRVRQIELTLERWRWLPPFQTPTIVVNIPQFRLFALNGPGDSEVDMLSMPVIVGKSFPASRTPVFISTLKQIVFRPYWDVPSRIALQELLPEVERHPGYLEENHFELVRGQTDASPVVALSTDNLRLLKSGAVRLRQRPGNDNALGLVKFVFPNTHDVFLHGTPAAQLFKQSRRAFSHGCIRVSDPSSLAWYVLRREPGDWNIERIASAMMDKDNARVTLTHPITVMILYGTAIANESGRVFLLDDVYGHDRKLERLLRASM
jgi:L,D-transpeptidase YcbB